VEESDAALGGFYDRLLAVLADTATRDGAWRLLECVPAWDGNWTWDGFIAWWWESPDGRRRLMAVNYSATRAQCYVRLPFPELAGRRVRLEDRLGPERYDRDGTDLVGRGLYLDLPAFGYHAFEVIVQ
jgi:hypothetical protein